MNDRPLLPESYSLLRLADIDSTNDEAKRHATSGAPHGLVVWADRQTAGHGRQGRVWQSPPGNLYFSILLRPERAAADVALLSFAAALALSDALTPLLPRRVTPRCKWPNDVLIAGKKIAGILLESEATGATVRWLVVGIGVNLASCPTDTETPATALAAHSDTAISPGALLAEICRHFVTWYGTWNEHGFAPLRTAWLARAEGLGGEIRVRCSGTETSGRFLDLDRRGALVLENEQGRRHISAGAVFPAA
jgi:BirA family biotin operon repressor/biotin-[acetyl-CoA-carboxylase] ligase